MSEEELRRAKSRAYVRKNRYGITELEYEELLVKQNNACAVCKIEFTDKVKPNVDHNHVCCPGTKSCGKCLRGLLCSNCLTLASLVETRFEHMNIMFMYLTYYLTNERGNK